MFFCLKCKLESFISAPVFCFASWRQMAVTQVLSLPILDCAHEAVHPLHRPLDFPHSLLPSLVTVLFTSFALRQGCLPSRMLLLSFLIPDYHHPPQVWTALKDQSLHSQPALSAVENTVNNSGKIILPLQSCKDTKPQVASAWLSQTASDPCRAGHQEQWSPLFISLHGMLIADV